MSVEAAILEHVLANEAVASLVGDRGYPEVAPQGAPLPLLITQLVTSVGDRHMQGPSGLAEARVQISITAETAASRAAVSCAVREALDGLQRTTIGTGDIATYVCSIRLDARRNTTEPVGDGGHTVRYRQHMDFMVWHRESVPIHS